MDRFDIIFVDGDEVWKERIGSQWGDKVARHIHLDDGFTVVATHQGEAVGLISIRWRMLPEPLSRTEEGFIDIIEVRAQFRRRGIARRLVEVAVELASSRGAYQLRAWSSDDKTEAIPMWLALGFGLCPATTYPAGRPIKGYYATMVLEAG